MCLAKGLPTLACLPPERCCLQSAARGLVTFSGRLPELVVSTELGNMALVQRQVPVLRLLLELVTLHFSVLEPPVSACTTKRQLINYSCHACNCMKFPCMVAMQLWQPASTARPSHNLVITSFSSLNQLS